jgi:hypothetical protein
MRGRGLMHSATLRLIQSLRQVRCNEWFYIVNYLLPIGKFTDGMLKSLVYRHLKLGFDLSIITHMNI